MVAQLKDKILAWGGVVMSKCKKIRKSEREDIHHLLYIRKGWSKGYNRELRNHWYMRVIIPKVTLHKQIHTQLEWITPPRGSSSRFALEHLAYLEKYGAIHSEDSIVQRLKVIIALFDGGADVETINDLKKQLEIATEFYNSLK